MRPKFRDFIAVILLNIIQYVDSDNILSCHPSILETCTGANQVCDAKTGECKCIEGFMMIEDICQNPSNEDLSPHRATATFVTIFTLALLICGLVLVVRRYNLIEYIQQKINFRRRHDIVYEDVMIGQDDPPLSP